MNLSEAIRLGAMMRPQCTGVMWVIPVALNFNSRTHSCALGAAFDAIMDGLTPQLLHYACYQVVNLLKSKFPILEELAPCPNCRCFNDSNVRSVIAHLNDYHHCTREQIADWVATLEVPTTIAPIEVITIVTLLPGLSGPPSKFQ